MLNEIKAFFRDLGVELPPLDHDPVTEEGTLKAYPRFSMELSDDSPTGLRTSVSRWTFSEPEGWDGTIYDNQGRVDRGYQAHSVKDVSVYWRGLRRDYGEAHRIFTTSTVGQRAVFSIINDLKSAPWGADSPEEMPDALAEVAELQNEAVETAMRELEGGYKRFLTEAGYSLLVPGFGIWQRIHNEDGSLRKLAFRRANVLDGVALDETQTKILAFRFLRDYRSAETYIVDARDCLVISFFGLGLDIEGLSPWRAACEYERAKQLLIQLQMLTAEIHGTPLPIVEASDAYVENKGDADIVAQAFNARRADNPETVILPKGLTARLMSVVGHTPPFEQWIRYCDEMIVLNYSSEGALFSGSSGHGSYAALDVKDKQQVRSSVALGDTIADALNGADNLEYTGPLKTMIDARGGPVGGLYPIWKIRLDDEEAEIADIASAASSGLVEVNVEVQKAIHERFRLPPPTGKPIATPAAAAPAFSESGNSWHKTSYDQILSAAGFGDASCGCGVTWSAPTDEIMHSLEFAAAQGSLFAAPDVDAARKAHEKTNGKIGRSFAEISKNHRAEWVKTSAGISPVELLSLREAFRTKYLPQYRDAALQEVADLRAKGGLSVVAEMGVIPKVPANVTGNMTAQTIQIADALALKSYNITEFYLLEHSQAVANGLPPAAYPAIPDASIYAKHAATTVGAVYAIGRQDMTEELVPDFGSNGSGGQGSEDHRGVFIGFGGLDVRSLRGSRWSTLLCRLGGV